MITFQGQKYQCEPGESVLDCLLRHDLEIPYSCRSGVCHTCLMRATTGTPSGESQKGLKPSLVSQNYFLSCSCASEQDMEVNLPDDAAFRFTSSVLSIDPLTEDIIRLRLERPTSYHYHGGQFITLFNADGVGRSYSLASLPVLDPFLELHIRLVPKGLVSGWVHHSLKVGDAVTISEASGNCFYTADNQQQGLLLIGTGSGLAPLYGILRDAIHHGHQGEIKLYHGSSTVAGIYLTAELKQLAANHHNFSYFPCVSRELPTEDMSSGRATAVALEQNPQLAGWRAYICGEPKMVNDTSRAVFMAGISLQEIYSDPFVHSNPL